MTIKFYLGEANVIANALNRKSTGNIAALVTSQQHILDDLKRLNIEIRICGREAHLANLQNYKFNLH